MDKQTNPIAVAMDEITHSPEITLVAGSIKGAMKAAGAGSRDLWFVPRSQIRVIEGFNVRIKNKGYQDHIDYLASSIDEVGFMVEHPLSGYVARDGADSVIYLTDGHCRLAAVDKCIAAGAEVEVVPVVVASQLRDFQELTSALVRSNTGKPLEPLETAAVCKRLSLFGWEDEKIAKRLGYTVNHVRELHVLIGAPAEIRLLVAEEKLAATTAIKMLTQHGDKAVEIINQGLEVATASGKSKVTQRFMVDSSVKFVKKAAPALFSVAKDVKSDPAYVNLNEATRAKLEDLLSGISSSEEKAKAKADAKIKALQEKPETV